MADQYLEDDTDYEFMFLLEYDFNSLTEDSEQETINEIEEKLKKEKNNALANLYTMCLTLGIEPDSFCIPESPPPRGDQKGYLNKARYHFSIEIEKIIFIEDKINYLKTIS